MPAAAPLILVTRRRRRGNVVPMTLRPSPADGQGGGVKNKTKTEHDGRPATGGRLVGTEDGRTGLSFAHRLDALEI
jgi:hypothetical protein